MVLQPEPRLAQKALERFSIPVNSTLGAVIANSGGIIAEDRLRIYGAGAVDIVHRNELYNAGCIIVAEDIYGGFFFFDSDGKILYFAPDTLAAETTDFAYNEFLFWAITGDIDGFYETFSYTGWKQEAKALQPDQGISFYPPLWTKEGKDPEQCSRKAIPMKELIGMELDLMQKLG